MHFPFSHHESTRCRWLPVSATGEFVVRTTCRLDSFEQWIDTTTMRCFFSESISHVSFRMCARVCHLRHGTTVNMATAIKSDVCFYSITRHSPVLLAFGWLVEWKIFRNRFMARKGFHVSRCVAGKCLTTNSHAYETTHSELFVFIFVPQAAVVCHRCRFFFFSSINDEAFFVLSPSHFFHIFSLLLGILLALYVHALWDFYSHKTNNNKIM